MPRYGHSKIGGMPKIAKFETPITPPRGPREKQFWVSKFLHRGTSTPKMIKIGEIRVLSYLYLSWNEPLVGRWGGGAVHTGSELRKPET